MTAPRAYKVHPGRWLVSLAVCLFSAGIGCSQEPARKPSGPSRSLPAIHSRAEFDSLAVVYDANTPYALPHVLFVIDRQSKNRIYYVNTKLFKFHKDFVNGTYLSLERGQEFFENPVQLEMSEPPAGIW